MPDEDLDELNRRKLNILSQLQGLRDRISEEEADAAVQKLMSPMQILKKLEAQKSEIQSNCDAKRCALQAEVNNLEEMIATGCDENSLLDGLDDSIKKSMEKLDSAKKELAAKLREILSLKRQLDDVPVQSELIQYERRFSELNAHMQEKLRQTRKYYATYNALLEVKELMLKETSLLNSISSQFQDAIASTKGRSKLLGSMEGIIKGSQQKLEKAQLASQEEKKLCDALKDKYAASVTEQRRCYSLLKAFQEECTRNERLKSQISAQKTTESSKV